MRHLNRIYSITCFFILTQCAIPDTVENGHVKYYGTFKEVPINQITPKGWLKEYLHTQKNGLTGHLEHAGYPFDKAGWGMPVTDTSSWWPYEQVAYWIDGMLTNGYLLSDSTLLKKAKSRIYPVLNRQTSEDPFIGPDYLRKEGKKYRWVHAVYFRALMKEFDATGNTAIVDAMQHFHLNQDIKRYLEVRDQANIENILWTYQKSENASLLELAKTIYDTLNYKGVMPHRPVKANDFLAGQPIYEHGVTYNEVAKLGAILYLYTGDQKYLDPAIAAYRIIDQYYMMVDGVNVSSEHTHTPAHALQTHETCDIADMTWSLGYLLMATGSASYADKIERAIYNAGPGAVLSDFKALQYFSGPNQVLATQVSNHNAFFKGNASMSFGPNPFTECCPANVTRITPNFAARLWMRNEEGGVAATMYAPSLWEGNIRGARVSIVENTMYPFSDEILFEVKTDRNVSFPLTLRIPQWCKSPELLINGEPSSIALVSGTYFKLKRTFKDGDKIKLRLRMPIQLSKWPEEGVAVERGPLVYALGIEENRQVVPPNKEKPKSSEQFPAYDIKPASSWNYALYLTDAALEDQITVINNQWSNDPWNTKTSPIKLRIAAKKIESWKTIKKNSVFYEKNVPVTENGRTVWKPKSDFERQGDFEFTPPLPSREELSQLDDVPLDTITLIPYGSTNLRIAIFPQLSN